MEQIVILSGTNMGDKARNLSDSMLFIVEELKSRNFRMEGLACSSVMESEPWGFDSDETFLNQIISFYSDVSPQELLKICKKVEKMLGREDFGLQFDDQGGRIYHSRPIDLDILFYGQEIIDTPDLKIPHPLLHKRLFALNPLCEVLPDFIHPGLKKTVKELHSQCLSAEN